MSLSKAVVGASLIVLMASSSAHAIVVVSNLSDSLDVDFTADGTHFATAGSFTTSAAGTYRLNSVGIPMPRYSRAIANRRLPVGRKPIGCPFDAGQRSPA